MAFDLSLITNAPNLTDRINQQRAVNSQLQGAQVDAQQKQFAYAAQVMSAAAGSGDPAQYANGKRLLASQGYDVSGWSDDPAIGFEQVKAARTALMTPQGMMNAQIQMQRNQIQAAGTNSTMAPTQMPDLYGDNPFRQSAPSLSSTIPPASPSTQENDPITASVAARQKFSQDNPELVNTGNQAPSPSAIIPVSAAPIPAQPRADDPKYAGLNPKGRKEAFEADLQAWNSLPDVKAAVASATGEASKTGEEMGEAGKTYDVALAGLPYALKRFSDMRDAAKNASSGLFVDNAGDGLAQQYQNTAMGKYFSPDTGTANQRLKQFSSQGILGELGPQLAQAGIRGNKFLESIAANASGLDMSAAPEDKTKIVDGLQEKYLQNLKTEAAVLRSHGKPALTDAQIDAMATSQPAGSPKVGTIMQGHVFLGGDPSKPTSWRAVK